MTANTVQANYDVLQTIAGGFFQQAQEIEEMRLRVSRSVEALRNKGWEGEAATAFFREMDDDIFPAVSRLQDAFEKSHAVTLDIVSILQMAEEEASEPFQSTSPFQSILSHILGTGGDLLGAIDKFADLKSAFKVIKNIDSWADLGNALKSWKSLGQISDELFDTLTFKGSKIGNAGTVLGMIGAMMEGVEDWQKGEGLATVAISESSEFVLDTAFHVAMYSNPITGTIMATYDIAQFAAPLFGIDPESFDVVDDVTDYMGDVIADPGKLVDDIGDVADTVGDFSGGLIDDAGDAISGAWNSLF